MRRRTQLFKVLMRRRTHFFFCLVKMCNHEDAIVDDIFTWHLHSHMSVLYLLSHTCTALQFVFFIKFTLFWFVSPACLFWIVKERRCCCVVVLLKICTQKHQWVHVFASSTCTSCGCFCSWTPHSFDLIAIRILSFWFVSPACLFCIVKERCCCCVVVLVKICTQTHEFMSWRPHHMCHGMDAKLEELHLLNICVLRYTLDDWHNCVVWNPPHTICKMEYFSTFDVAFHHRCGLLNNIGKITGVEKKYNGTRVSKNLEWVVQKIIRLTQVSCLHLCRCIFFQRLQFFQCSWDLHTSDEIAKMKSFLCCSPGLCA